MKALCIETNKDNSVINAELIVGREYIIEDATTGSNAQNSAFHALVQEYFKSGLHSYDNDFETFRNQIKKYLGEGFNAYVYAIAVGDKANIKSADNYEDIPEYIRKDPDYCKMIQGKLKSWKKYTKKERKNTIDNLISQMRQAGVNSKKFDEIIKGMEKC